MGWVSAKEYLMSFFDSVYCDTCRNVDNESACDYCHRKSMNWAISESAVDKILSDLANLPQPPKGE